MGCQKTTVPPKPELSPAIIPSPTPTVSPISAEDRKEAAELRQLGLNYRQQGQFYQAIKTLEESVTLDSQNLSGLVLLGWTYHLDKQPEPAQKTYNKAIRLDSRYRQITFLDHLIDAGFNAEQVQQVKNI